MMVLRLPCVTPSVSHLLPRPNHRGVTRRHSGPTEASKPYRRRRWPRWALLQIRTSWRRLLALRAFLPGQESTTWSASRQHSERPTICLSLGLWSNNIPVEVPKGHPNNLLSEAEIHAKSPKPPLRGTSYTPACLCPRRRRRPSTVPPAL